MPDMPMPPIPTKWMATSRLRNIGTVYSGPGPRSRPKRGRRALQVLPALPQTAVELSSGPDMAPRRSILAGCAALGLASATARAQPLAGGFQYSVSEQLMDCPDRD